MNKTNAESDGLDGWTFAKNLKEMPSKSGRYLIMNQLGSFFVGCWDAHERRLYTQCMGYSEDESRLRTTSGDVKMARWDWKTSGRVYWKDVGDLNFYRIWQRASAKPAGAARAKSRKRA